MQSFETKQDFSKALVPQHLWQLLLDSGGADVDLSSGLVSTSKQALLLSPSAHSARMSSSLSLHRLPHKWVVLVFGDPRVRQLRHHRRLVAESSIRFRQAA